MSLAPREQENEGAEGGEQHGTDDGDGDVGAVEAVERDRDHKGHPEHGVEDDGRPDPLGRQRETRIGATYAVRGEQPVAEAGAPGGAARDHMAHCERGQVYTEHL